MFSLNQKKPIYEVVIMGFFIKEHLSLEGSFILKFVPPIFLICLIDKGSYPGLQADDMTVYNELENRKLIVLL